MGREVEYTEEFESWWNRLTEGEQERIDTMVNLLRREGTALGYPRSSQVKTSRHSRMRELRVTTAGRAIRINQENVSRLEQRTDLLISTLRGYVAAMGGKLSLVVEFPDRPPVALTGLAALDDPSESDSSTP